jgi:hypothetical protein
MNIIYVSFVTKNSPYEKVVEDYLLPTLKKFNLPYDIDYIETKKSWMENIQYKPTFLKNMLLKHKCPIVSLDADATIEKDPVLFNTISEHDIGAFYLDWKMWYSSRYDKKELLGGTLYFNYNDKVLAFLDKWIQKQNEKMQWAQRVLQQLVLENPDIKIYSLPIEYCFIDSNKFPNLKKEAVIIHHQLSRKYRHWKKK